jgi:glutamate synthase domain-containing protein 3
MDNKKDCSYVKVKNDVATINAANMPYRDLNSVIKAHCNPVKRIDVRKVSGQRYIGTGLKNKVELHVYGTPGNDLAAFMDGSTVYVHGNAQDGVGNTMNSGKVVIYGHAGDIPGYSMRGGKVFIRDDVGYRAGIHMKEYQELKPIMVIGGSARDFLGEYMAGGIIMILGLNLCEGECCKARFVGTGMHGGVIYMRGDILELGKGTKIMKIGKRDKRIIESLVKEYCDHFGVDFEKVMSVPFRRIVPVSKRPYESLYSE